MSKVLNRFERRDTIIAVFSMVLGVIGVLTKVFLKSSLTQNREMGLTAPVFTLENLGAYVVFALLCYVVLQKILDFLVKIDIYEQQSSKKMHKNLFIKVFIFNMTCWGVWFWLYYPGAGMNDTINCITSFHDDIQPLIYQLIIYFGIHGLTRLTSNMTVSYAILTLAQMIFMSSCIAWIACWLCKKGVKRAFVNIFVAYYAIMPTVADYSITLVKDTLFGICIMMSIPFLYDIVTKPEEAEKDRKFQLIFLMVMLGICFLRSNGKLVVLIMLLLLLKQMKSKRFPVVLLTILVITTGIVAVGENKLKSGDVNFREAIGIPLTQIGAVLAVDGYISEEDRQTLKNVLPLDTWKEMYCFWYADSIKFNGDFDNEWLNMNKGAFINSWFSVLKNNFDTYIKAYLCQTYGIWNISPFNPTDFTQSYFTRINNNTGDDSEWGMFCIAHDLVNREIQPASMSEQISDFFYKLFCINLILRPGIMYWMAIWFMIVLCILRKYRLCYIFLPVVLNWITMMIASPASYMYRYSFYLTLSLPLLFMIMLMQMKSYK